MMEGTTPVASELSTDFPPPAPKDPYAVTTFSDPLTHCLLWFYLLPSNKRTSPSRVAFTWQPGSNVTGKTVIQFILENLLNNL